MSKQLLGFNKIAVAFLAMVGCYCFSDISENIILQVKWQASEDGHYVLDHALYLKIIGCTIAALSLFMSAGFIALVAWLNISFVIKVISYLIFQSLSFSEVTMVVYLVISGFADGGFFLAAFVIYFTQGINLQSNNPVNQFNSATANNAGIMLQHLLFIASFSIVALYIINSLLAALEGVTIIINMLVYVAFAVVSIYLWRLRDIMRAAKGLELYNPNILKIAKYIQLEILGIFTISFIILKIYYNYALIESAHNLLMMSNSRLYLLLIGVLAGINAVRLVDLSENLVRIKIKCYGLLLILFFTLPNWGRVELLSNLIWPLILGIVSFLFVCNQYGLMNKFSGNNLIIAMLINAVFGFCGMLSEAIGTQALDMLEIERAFVNSISLLLVVLAGYNFYVYRQRLC